MSSWMQPATTSTLMNLTKGYVTNNIGIILILILEGKPLNSLHYFPSFQFLLPNSVSARGRSHSHGAFLAYVAQTYIVMDTLLGS